MRIETIIALVGIVYISFNSQLNGQVVLKIIPPQLEDLILRKDCEFQLINKQEDELDIMMQLKIYNDTNSCILMEQSRKIKLIGNQNIFVNWDTLCLCRKEDQRELGKLEKGIYSISIIAKESNSTEIIGSDCLQIFYSKQFNTK